MSKISVLLIAFLLATPAGATELGDPAPALAIDAWVKGDAVSLQDGQGKKIYVIEFWATWCGPCLTSIPHLSELQKKYREHDVVVIGVSNEKRALVQKFVEKMGDEMDYTVAIDDNGKTSQRYMRAFGQNGIPHAFVVDREGAIVWHGHPLDNLDRALDDIVNNQGRQTGVLLRQQKMARRYFQQALDGSDADALRESGAQIYQTYQDDADFLGAFAFTLLSAELLKAPDYDLALQCAARANELSTGKNPAILDTLALAHFKKRNLTEAIALQQQAIALCNDQQVLSYLEKNLERYRKTADAQAAQQEPVQ